MKIGSHEIGIDHPVFFIADIGSNHDGSLDRAEKLIYAAAEAGADAVKFQNFRANTIVSEYGFKELGSLAHQSRWTNGVCETYKRYETPIEWTPALKSAADIAGVEYLTTPYDISLLPYLAEYVAAWKIGSGDITYTDLIKAVGAYDKPLLLGTGASTSEDIWRALDETEHESIENIVIMQCNSNYSGEWRNLDYVNLKVLVSWWGGGVLGFSDHTPGHSSVLGAVALAARVIEKHFTDDNKRDGPDHSFAMNPITWATMVARTRELEQALGDGLKKVEDNEKETVIIQRRAVRAAKPLKKGERITKEDLVCLRPCPPDALPPYRCGEAVGLRLDRDIPEGDYIRVEELETK